MYAIVEIAGKQFKVAQDHTVMLKDNDGNVQVGQPYIAGANVKATVLKHLKGEKVLVFKKIRRKGYQKMNGHRDYLTQIQINSIN